MEFEVEEIQNNVGDLEENMPAIETLEVIDIDTQRLSMGDSSDDIDILEEQNIQMDDSMPQIIQNKTEVQTFHTNSQNKFLSDNQADIMQTISQSCNESHIQVISQEDHSPHLLTSVNSEVVQLSDNLESLNSDLVQSNIQQQQGFQSIMDTHLSPAMDQPLIIQSAMPTVIQQQSTIRQQSTTPTSMHSATPPIIQSSTPVLIIECTACRLPIKERYLLKAMDSYWHEDCLKCSCCDCRLGEVGSSLYTKANLLLCKRDYLRLFGSSGTCTVCRKTIPAFEMVMKVKSNVYHLECFACQQCRQRFCVGDKFYLCENRILCEYDFEEQNLITSIQRGYNALSHMRRQAETLSDISSGYGSPSPGTL